MPAAKDKSAVTSIKLPLKLKERMRKLIEKTDETVHGFMLRALERQTELSELRAQHLEEAEAAYDETLAGGRVHEAAEVKAYLEKRRTGGKATPIPKGKPWRG